MTNGQSADGSSIAQADRGGHASVVVFQEAAAAAVDEDVLSRGVERLGDLPVDDVPPVAALPE